MDTDCNIYSAFGHIGYISMTGLSCDASGLFLLVVPDSLLGARVTVKFEFFSIRPRSAFALGDGYKTAPSAWQRTECFSV